MNNSEYEQLCVLLTLSMNNSEYEQLWVWTILRMNNSEELIPKMLLLRATDRIEENKEYIAQH